VASVAPKRAAVLGQVDPVAAMRGDQSDPTVGAHPVEAIAIVGGIPDRSRRIVGKEADIQRLRDEPKGW
jgi:hypothetical protein